MKAGLILLFLLLCPLRLSSQVGLEHYMSFVGRGSSQGADCYDRYLFVGNQDNRVMDVYDLEDKCLVGHINISGSAPRCHANNVNFGAKFYQEGDEFPLLYVSSGYITNQEENTSDVYVYRIKKGLDKQGKEKFSATKVQTITLKEFNGWTDCICDNAQDALWIRYNHGGKPTYLKYAMPNPHLANVSLSPNDVAIHDSIVVERIGAIKTIQGSICRDGYIIYPAGHTCETPYFVAINQTARDYEYIVNLYDVEGFDARSHSGVWWEPEYIFFYRGDYYLGFRKSIYKMDIALVKQSNFFYNRFKALQ